MPNRIFRSGRGNARTISDKTTPGGLQPGTAVFVGATTITLAESASGGHLGLLGDRDFYGLADLGGPDSQTAPLDKAYSSGETAIVYMIEPDQEYLWRAAAGTYSTGQELTVGLLGRLRAAASGDTVVAYFDRNSGGVGAGDLVDVVIAHFHRKA